jgi:transcriptional regulator with XRE-family HTH domain
MKNRLKEFRLKRELTPAALAKAIEFNGVKFTKQQILAAESGEPEGFGLDLLFKASGKLSVPFHKMLYIPIDGYSEISKKGDPTCLACAVCSVLEGWFDISNRAPNLEQVGKWALKTYRATLKLKLNFTESREYGQAIVRPKFDPKPFEEFQKCPKGSG